MISLARNKIFVLKWRFFNILNSRRGKIGWIMYKKKLAVWYHLEVKTLVARDQFYKVSENFLSQDQKDSSLSKFSYTKRSSFSDLT